MDDEFRILADQAAGIYAKRKGVIDAGFCIIGHKRGGVFFGPAIFH